MLAAFVHGAFGFGFPLLATPLLVFGFELQTAILLTLVPTVSINLVSILSEHNWRTALRDYWPIPMFTIIGSFTGTQVLLSVDPAPFRFLLAAVLIGYLVSDHLHR
ncbi:MAG: sulfite exporter TauE/SafE family protein, partial [Gammaproteobacteria bacterium]|nr:sulfite exporter TauE/SafE family protein [Gammaproteobacteria bacterium]